MSVILQRLRFAPQDWEAKTSLFNQTAWRRKRDSLYWRNFSPVAGEILLGDTRLDGDTFFNAFPLAAWRALTGLKTLSLHLSVTGRFRLELFAQNGLGLAEKIGSFDVQEGEFHHPFDLDALPCRHALRLHFTLTAAANAALQEGSWTTDDPVPPAKLVILAAVRRPTAYLGRLLADPLLEAEGVRLCVVEQSPAPVLEGLAGPRCRIVRQRNLGSAGGIGRALLEEAESGATHFLTVDDDVEFDPDVVLRALRAAQMSRTPTILGGMFLDPLQPNLLTSAGSILHWNERGFWQATGQLYRANVGLTHGLDACSLPIPGGVPTWSFTLLPAAAVHKIGLPLPLFLAHDLDYGQRAAEAGYAVRTLPGVGAWQFYTLERRGSPETMFLEQYNLLLFNARRGYPACAGLFRNNIGRAMGHLLKNRHLGAAAIIMALEHFLGGWRHFRSRVLPGCLKAPRQELSLYPPEFNPMPHPALHTHLVGRLDRALEAFQKNGFELQQEWAAKLPLTASPAAWRGYAESGNLTTLPE